MLHVLVSHWVALSDQRIQAYGNVGIFSEHEPNEVQKKAIHSTIKEKGGKVEVRDATVNSYIHLS